MADREAYVLCKDCVYCGPHSDETHGTCQRSSPGACGYFPTVRIGVADHEGTLGEAIYLDGCWQGKHQGQWEAEQEREALKETQDGAGSISDTALGDYERQIDG